MPDQQEHFPIQHVKGVQSCYRHLYLQTTSIAAIYKFRVITQNKCHEN